MKLDTVLTVAIGDMDSEGAKLSPTEWSDFRSDMRQVLDGYGLVVAEAVGEGVGSDGVNEGAVEATCVYIVINPDPTSIYTGRDWVDHFDYTAMRAHVAQVARAYGQSSVCFAIDHNHEPVFTATRDGSRPLTLDEVVADILSNEVVEAVYRYLDAGGDGIEDIVRQAVETWEPTS